MDLTTWKDAPDGKIQKFDVTVAKNYLTEKELKPMSRIVSAYLDFAEAKAEDEIPMTVEDWAKQFEGILRLSQKGNFDKCRSHLCGDCQTARRI